MIRRNEKKRFTADFLTISCYCETFLLILTVLIPSSAKKLMASSAIRVHWLSPFHEVCCTYIRVVINTWNESATLFWGALPSLYHIKCIGHILYLYSYSTCGCGCHRILRPNIYLLSIFHMMKSLVVHTCICRAYYWWFVNENESMCKLLCVCIHQRVPAKESWI